MNTPVRRAVLLSGGGRTLQNLIDRIQDGTLRAQIEVVVSSKDGVFGLERARKHDLPTRVVGRKAFPDTDAFSSAMTAALEPFRPDLVLMAGFLHLYRFPGTWKNRVMNIHPALLPKFGGKGFYGHRVHEAVLAAGEKESGCTVHFADHQYDRGPIILQRRVPVLPDDTPDRLARRVFEAECIAYPEAVGKVAGKDYQISSTPGDE